MSVRASSPRPTSRSPVTVPRKIASDWSGRSGGGDRRALAGERRRGIGHRAQQTQQPSGYQGEPPRRTPCHAASLGGRRWENKISRMRHGQWLRPEVRRGSRVVRVDASQGRRGRDTGSYLDPGERREAPAWAAWAPTKLPGVTTRGRPRPGSGKARRRRRPRRSSSSWLADLGEPGAVQHHDQIGHSHRAEPVRDQHVMPPTGYGGLRRRTARRARARSRRPGRPSARRGSSAVARSACSRGTAPPSATGRSSAPARRPNRHPTGSPAPPAAVRTTSSAPARVTADETADRSSRCGRSPTPTLLLSGELEPEEVLERAGQPVPPGPGPNPAQRDGVDHDLPGRGLVHLGQQLDQGRLPGAVLPDDGHHRAGRQVQGRCRPGRGRLRARVGEADASPAGCRPASRSGRCEIGVAHPRRRRSPPARSAGATRPARCRAEIRSRPWCRRRRRRAVRRQPGSTAPWRTGAARPTATKTTAPT